jgi:3-oxoacyl-[acyl-carrier protein] reductase
MVSDLQGQKALVTGASRGIGKAIALELGKQGAFVIGTATADAGVDNIRANFSSEAIEGMAMVLNVSDMASVEALGKALIKEDLTPGILVNNAGITRDNLLIRMKDYEWNDVINTDLNSIYRLCKLCLRGMMKMRYGRIINITSVVALSGNSGQVNYAAAKSGIIGFTKSLAKEVGSRNITVNAIAPGFIISDMTNLLSETQKKEMLGQIPLGRLGNAEEIASVVSFLVSPGASYITGETINVNGGMYMV